MVTLFWWLTCAGPVVETAVRALTQNVSVAAERRVSSTTMCRLQSIASRMDSRNDSRNDRVLALRQDSVNDSMNLRARSSDELDKEVCIRVSTGSCLCHARHPLLQWLAAHNSVCTCHVNLLAPALQVYNYTGETGTYRYMAPEVYRHEPYNGKADVYRCAASPGACAARSSTNISFECAFQQVGAGAALLSSHAYCLCVCIAALR